MIIDKIMDFFNREDRLMVKDGGQKINLFEPELDESTLDMEWKQDEFKYVTQRYQGSPKDIANNMKKDELFKNLMYKYHGTTLSGDPENPLDWEARTKFPKFRE